MRSIKSNENIHKKEDGSYHVVSTKMEIWSFLISKEVLKMDSASSKTKKKTQNL